MGRYKEHPCKNPECSNMTTNKSYCCRACRNTGECKGKPLSEERKKHLSEAFSGEGNPFYGKSHSESSKEVIQQKALDRNSDESYRKMISDKTVEGMKNYEYTPGVGGYRDKAIEHYGYECSVCKKTEGVLQVHHIDGNHDNDDIDNLVVLCISCHRKAHYVVDSNGQFVGNSSINEEFRSVILASRGGAGSE